MNAHADKKLEVKSKSGANATAQMQSMGGSDAQFLDSRPVASAQRNFQAMADRSLQATQLKSLGDTAISSAYSKQTMQLQSMANSSSAGVVQRVEPEDEGRRNSRENFAKRRKKEVEGSIGGQAAAKAGAGGLKKVGFDGRAASKVNASIRGAGEAAEGQESGPFIGPMPEGHGKKAKDDTDLGGDLSMVQDEVQDYDFDPKSDHQSAPIRYLGNKLSGAANYVKKHPGKAFAKALPVVPIAMNVAGAVRSHGKSKEARKEETSPDASEAQKLMWNAHKKSQQKNRNKKAISAAVGVATTAAGGMLDMGAGNAAGDLFAETGSAVLDGAASEAFETIGQFADATSASDALGGFGMAAGEAMSEDVIGSTAEDVEEGVQDKRRGRLKPKPGQQKLIPKARLARGELNKDGGDKALAHKSLLSKDLKYGKAVRKTIRGTLDETLPDGAAPAEADEMAKRSKSQMLGHFKESIGEQDKSKRVTDGEKTLVPSAFEGEQRKTKGAAKHRLRKELGYAKDSTRDGGGSQMTQSEAESADGKIEDFKKKKWYES